MSKPNYQESAIRFLGNHTDILNPKSKSIGWGPGVIYAKSTLSSPEKIQRNPG